MEAAPLEMSVRGFCPRSMEMEAGFRRALELWRFDGESLSSAGNVAVSCVSIVVCCCSFIPAVLAGGSAG